jgi:hypothetical protein
MSLETILDACATLALTASGIGVVRDHEMFIKDQAGLRDHFMSGGVINALEIDRVSTPAERYANHRTQRSHLIHFHFYYGLSESDDTRPAFRALVEAVEAVFRAEYRLSETAQLAGPFNVEVDGYIEKCGMLLHYAQASLIAREELT